MNSYNLSLEEENILIEKEFNEILDHYMHSKHRKKKDPIVRAFEFARKAHEGVRRKSGEPYILHPLAVARIICFDMGLGSTSIMAAFLHDVVEDTDCTKEDIELLFGKKVAQLVDGVTKLPDNLFEGNDEMSAQAENFRNLFLTMATDIRVIMIKLADRLHNMRTIGSMPTHKQLKIAGETLYIYAPIAYKLGLFAIKTELEELSFAIEHPLQHETIKNKILSSQKEQEEIFENFIAPIRPLLNDLDISYEIKSRVKSAYSIWQKMQRNNLSFDEVFDIYAVRIIFTPKEGENENDICWKIFSRISYNYPMKPDRTRDWISMPKGNGYKALHMTVMGPHHQWIEVQIRSKKMDDIAEMGLAAHWKYKTGDNFHNPNIEKWIYTIRELLESPDSNAMDLLDTIKLNLYTDEITVYTPKGDRMILPQNASVLDFAFQIHGNIGLHCIAAKVNTHLAPLSHILENGDQVEIITSNNKRPEKEWLNHVITAKAISGIKSYLRKDYRKNIVKGENILREKIKEENLSLNKHQTKLLATHFNYETIEDFFYSIALAEIELPPSFRSAIETGSENAFYKKVFRNKSFKNEKEEDSEIINTIPIDKKKPYILRKNDFSQNYVTSSCCTPIYGDNTIGFIAKSGDVYLHQRSCPKAMRLKSKSGNTIVATQWGEHPNSFFEVALQIKGIDSTGILNAIVNYISKDVNISISQINMASNMGVFEGKVKVLARNRDDIDRICSELPKNPFINSVVRI